MPTIIEASYDAKGKSFAIVATRWNEFIVDKLVEGAVDCLTRHGADDKNITIVYCPGSYEIPLVTKKLAASNKYSAVITLGAVIRGVTSHYDLVAGAVASGVAQVGMETGIPCLFGVLTTDTIEQAIERAGTKAGNKGIEVVQAAIEMANLLKQL